MLLRRLSPEIGRFVTGMESATLAIVERFALAFATLGGQRSHSEGQSSESKRSRPSGSHDGRRDRGSGPSGWTGTQSQGRSGVPSATRQSEGERQCYNCASTDHVKRDCPQPLKSFYSCGRQGHMRRFCRIGRVPGVSASSVNQGYQQQTQSQQPQRQFRAPQQSQQTGTGGQGGRGSEASRS